MRPLRAAAAVAFLTGCAQLDELERARVPIDQAAAISLELGAALRAADLNGDGAIQGAAEWVALAEGLYAIVRDV